MELRVSVCQDVKIIYYIMFQMKTELDETSTKHKNEDFFKNPTMRQRFLDESGSL